MPRVKRGVTARAKHKKVISQAKGYRGRNKNVFRVAKQAVTRAGQYEYRDRRQRKRQFRRLWITRISAAAKITVAAQAIQPPKRTHPRPDPCERSGLGGCGVGGSATHSRLPRRKSATSRAACGRC